LSLLRITPQRSPLSGSVPVPDDEEVLMARLALAAVSRGTSTIETLGPLYGAPHALAEGLELLGVTVEGRTGRGGQTLRVAGRGLLEPFSEGGVLDARGEPSLAAVLLGVAAGRPSRLQLLADEIVAELLGPQLVHAFGARLTRHEGGVLVDVPGRDLGARPPGLVVETSGVMPWVKQTHLLLGLRARTSTLVTEAVASSDHLERALLRARVPLSIQGTSIELHPPRDEDALAPDRFHSVGSLSAAMTLLSASALVPESHVVVRGVAVGPSRSDALTVLRLLGHEVGLSPRGDQQGEPWADLSCRSRSEGAGGTLRSPSVLAGETVVRMADGVLSLLPVLAICDRGRVISDLVAVRRGADPRVFVRASAFLRAAGVDVAPEEASLVLGPRTRERRFAPLRVTTGGDGRLALLGALIALGADGVSEIDDVDCLSHVFPRFVGTLRALGAQVEVSV
jgi:3-phosphoshikimate 1-carboxyvinyltransferase